ncbi:hypothetical protein BC826DRAFT_1049435 [Russula brevipes]|nr:hypothetical protein BC826DRAFT_1049435 [Russula brevipes]
MSPRVLYDFHCLSLACVFAGLSRVWPELTLIRIINSAFSNVPPRISFLITFSDALALSALSSYVNMRGYTFWLDLIH